MQIPRRASDRHRAGVRATRAGTAIKPFCEPLEDRVLLANIFEINSAIIRSEAGRVGAKQSIAANILDLRSQLIDFQRTVTEKRAEIRNDFLDIKQQEMDDRARLREDNRNGDLEDAQQAREAIREDIDAET